MYAQYDGKVSYCQGMNYIMGFMLSLFKNEETAFKFFAIVMVKRMKGFFDNEFKILQCLFYQLDRLIAIFLPDLSSHFEVICLLFIGLTGVKKEKVDSSLFSPSWFITLFTVIYQSNQDSYFLLRAWDSFLLVRHDYCLQIGNFSCTGWLERAS